MINASLITKRDAAVKFFKERQGLDCFKVENTDDKFRMSLLQWGNVDKIYKIKPTNDLPHFLKYTKEDLEKVDAVLFICETFGWRQAYAVKVETLEKFLNVDGNGEINIDCITCSNYFFFDMVKALQWIS